mgnify:CR=1 FL=1
MTTDRCTDKTPHGPHRTQYGPFGVKDCPGVAKEPATTDRIPARDLGLTTTEQLRRRVADLAAELSLTRDALDRAGITTGRASTPELVTWLVRDRDEALDARDVLRAQLDQARTELGAAQELIAELRNNRERDDRALAAYDTRPQQLATGGIVTTTPKLDTDSCVIPRSSAGLGSAAPRAQGIRPAAWEQHATNAISAALSQTWDWSDGSVMPARIAEVAVRAIVDAGLAGPGGRCPTCGETYPRTMPAGEDQRCWTCSTQEVVGLPEYGGTAEDARRRHTAAFNALSRTLTLVDPFMPLSVRERCAEAVLAALDGLEPTASAPKDLAALADRIAQAIGDPGSIVIRREGESVTRWSTRAVLLVLAEQEG